MNTELDKNLKLGKMDHYTLIVEDAEKVADFHINYLGFKYKYEKRINTGTVKEHDFDMINHILTLPNNENVFCVVTQGLNEQTVFTQYLKKYGPGIHHVAFKVLKLEDAWQFCIEKKIRTTSEQIISDPVTGLKQFFIEKNYAGYFIELIDRNKVISSAHEDFTAQNMKLLSNSIKNYLKD